MQSVSARIWTRVAVSISYDYNHYTTIITGASKFSKPSSYHLYLMIYLGRELTVVIDAFDGCHFNGF